MPSIRILAAVLSLSPIMATSALAQTAPAEAGPPRPAGGHSRTAFIEGYDTNRDGKVDRAEYDAVRDARFRAGDADNDGFLTEEEYTAEYAGRLRAQYAAEQRQPDDAFERQVKQAGVRFYAIDRDRDGRISADENRAVAQRTFESQDTDNDGVVSQQDPQRVPTPEPTPAAGQ